MPGAEAGIGGLGLRFGLLVRVPGDLVRGRHPERAAPEANLDIRMVEGVVTGAGGLLDRCWEWVVDGGEDRGAHEMLGVEANGFRRGVHLILFSRCFSSSPL